MNLTCAQILSIQESGVLSFSFELFINQLQAKDLHLNNLVYTDFSIQYFHKREPINEKKLSIFFKLPKIHYEIENN